MREISAGVGFVVVAIYTPKNCRALNPGPLHRWHEKAPNESQWQQCFSVVRHQPNFRLSTGKTRTN